jgi:hypothetical protein
VDGEGISLQERVRREGGRDVADVDKEGKRRDGRV